MDIIIKDYYKGFEGYPEIDFVLKQQNSDNLILKMWEGYFETIMDLIEPEESGWTGLAYYYNLVIGWVDESPWEIPDITEAIEQYKKIDMDKLNEANKLNKMAKKVLTDILDLLIKAQSEGATVFINYD